jgi:hypothetical protein
MNNASRFPRALLLALALAIAVWGCQSASENVPDRPGAEAAIEEGSSEALTYDRHRPAVSMQRMSTDLPSEQEEQFIQAIGVLVGEFAFQTMMGEGSNPHDPVLNERLRMMHGMTAEEIVAYAREVQAARLGALDDSADGR